MNCPEKVQTFKDKAAHKILGVKIVDGNIMYLLKYKRTMPAELITWIKGRNCFDGLLLNFYESRLDWVNGHEMIHEMIPLRENGETDAIEPIKITCKLCFIERHELK